MNRALAAPVLLLLAGCAGLSTLPPPTQHCDVQGDLPALWQCIGKPDPTPKESGLTGTLRLANGDLTRRLLLNQTPSLACNKKPWRGFEHKSLAAAGDAAPLEAFVHGGNAGAPVVLVIHGLYDSNSNRYIRYVASALADNGFGVVVPDMRWHGCLMSYLTTLGADESKDLLSWATAIRSGALTPALGGRPIGLIGFSLGAFDVIDTISEDHANVFDAGGIAVSPPARLDEVLTRLDRMRTPIGYYFRSTLRIRNRRLGIAFWAARPFRSYLEYFVEKKSLGNPDAFLQLIEPSKRLAAVQRPLLILVARNDPVLGRVASDAIENATKPANVHVIATNEGGHIGIIGRDSQWFVNAMINFFANRPQP